MLLILAVDVSFWVALEKIEVLSGFQLFLYKLCKNWSVLFLSSPAPLIISFSHFPSFNFISFISVAKEVVHSRISELVKFSTIGKYYKVHFSQHTCMPFLFHYH